ncbi:hypothetical protein PhaeoP72_01192 [Phaeobacter inhibens]|nr:hypothetical protein PhaeoP72_01192 [Phaeobacter inhibens]
MIGMGKLYGERSMDEFRRAAANLDKAAAARNRAYEDAHISGLFSFRCYSTPPEPSFASYWEMIEVQKLRGKQ